MSIRSTVKAVVVHNGRLLLIKRRGPDGEQCYALPGGGQRQYETMEEAVVRECLEETGYAIFPVGFAALYEEIVDDEEVRTHYPDYAHKVYHVFVCRLQEDAQNTPTEEDWLQVGCEWVDLADVQRVDLRPSVLRDAIASVLKDGIPVYLGSGHE